MKTVKELADVYVTEVLGVNKDTSLVAGDGRVEWGQPGWSKDDQERFDKSVAIMKKLKSKLTTLEKDKLNAVIKAKGTQSMLANTRSDPIIHSLYRFV
jgi:hypothetical protein|tara:strand:+ start:18244 stop:18537 length:294 start_codon:yes stop_codon:yes gene_type:complete